MFKPLLAVNVDLTKLEFPLYASYKLDGIRCLLLDDVVSRTNKVIPNDYIRSKLLPYLELKLDGELIVGGITNDCYQITQSAVMAKLGEPTFIYYVFDTVDTNNPYRDRYSRLLSLDLPNYIQVVEQYLIEDLDSLLELEAKALSLGYEGLMLRSIDGKYKLGRSTTKEAILLKLKRFNDSEALVIDYKPLVRSSGLVENSLGYLVCQIGDISFHLGTGFTSKQRKEYWGLGDSLIGSWVKFKYLEVGVKDKPRHPVFLGFRDPIDFLEDNEMDNIQVVAGRRTFTNEIERGRPIKILVNIGACLDIITGRYITGKYGESILNGGLANLTGITGGGNSFKSTIGHYMQLAGLNRLYASRLLTYDTELNIQEWRLTELAYNVQLALGYDTYDVIAEGVWSVTDKTKYSGNKWYEAVRDIMKKRRNKPEKDEWTTTPFLDRDGNNLKMLLADLIEIDSFSEINTDAVERMQDDAEVGESGQNAVSLKQGQHKNQILMELPGLTTGSDTYMLLTSHFGDSFEQLGNPKAPPDKKLATLPAGKKIKGTPEKFTFVTQNCWWTKATKILLTEDSKRTPLYPRDEYDDQKGDTDLHKVTLAQVRGKAGPTGIMAELIVSQNLGVLPSLTEFHYIKECNRFGLEGNNVNYHLLLLPDVNITRTKVRRLLDNNAKLRRAVNILAELCQMQEYWFHMPKVHITPTELYERIKAAGYDWDFILSNTRGYWILEEDKRPQGLFLSTMDLINMVTPNIKGELYHPYWLEDDKRTVRAEFRYQLKEA